MHLLLSSLIILISLLSFESKATNSATVSILTENYPPLNYIKDKKLVGPAVDVINLIKDRLNSSEPIKVLPWARAYHKLETLPNVALFSMTRSPQRENQFKWVGPLAEKSIGFFAKENSSISLNSFEDAKSYKIAVQLNGVGMQMLKEKGFQRLASSTTAKANLRKLDKNRVDLWYASNATVSGNCTALKMKTCPFKPVFMTKITYMYLAFSKNTSEQIVTQWQKTLESLHEEGRILKIYKKHGLSTLYPQKLENQK